MTVCDLKVGQKGHIDNIYGNEKIVKIAPLGDPIVVRFRGFDLALRKSDAKNISLK